jgi:hypothetical protein
MLALFSESLRDGMFIVASQLTSTFEPIDGQQNIPLLAER